MKEHLQIISNFDNLPLDALITSPSHPKGIVVLAHGMCEHKERYNQFIDYLTKNNYVCVINDHRGHGKSILKKDDLGYFYENGHIGIVEDMHQLVTMIKSRYKHLPVYLFGHSMGSLVVRNYIKKYDNEINGLIVCGSPSYNSSCNLAISVCDILTKFKGDHHRSNLLRSLSVDAFNKNFDKNVRCDWLCTDRKVVDEYNNDPLSGFTFTTNGFKSLFLLMKETYSLSNWNKENLDLPIHFIAGEDDPCITNTKEFNNSVNVLKEVGYKNVSSHLFKNMRHEILNEKKKEIVYQNILKTLNSWE